MTIELLYFDGCPNVKVTADRLKSILSEAGLHDPITYTRVLDVETARSVRFLGSPSIRVNGVDIEPAARSRTDYGLMCRTYLGSGGAPSEALIRSAVAEAMADNQRLETEFEGMRLVVEARPDHWQVFVYDVENCEVLHAAQRMRLDSAKYAAVEYAAAHRFGPRHDLEPEIVATMLVWESL